MRRAEFPSWLRYVFVVAGALVVGSAVSVALPSYFVFLAVTAIIGTISLAGLGIVSGSAGMIALCQMSFAAIGAWTVTALNVAGAPGGLLLWIVLGTLIAGAAGFVIGLPALRLRGVNLAVVTLGFAAAIDATIIKFQFPGAATFTQVLRPSFLLTDRQYLFFCVVVLVVVGLIVHLLQRGTLGVGWQTLAFSERAVAASGHSVAGLKLLAFGISAAVGGLSGGLLVGQLGGGYSASFGTLQSLALYLLTVIVGSQFIEMALLAGIIMVALPEILKRIGIPQDWGLVLFGVTGVQALAMNSTLGQQIRDGIARRRRRRPAATRAALTVPVAGAADAVPPKPPALALDPVLSVHGLSVGYGAVKALDDVDVELFPATITGLIGPNGAGKSTFVDAVTGYIYRYGGTVSLDGTALESSPPHRRARLGLRRTFQQTRVPSGMTVGGYVRSVSRGRSTPAETSRILAEFGCPPPASRLSDVDGGTRRLIEVVAHICAKPKVLLLDEPAAGFSHDEHISFGERLRDVPARYGIAVMLIEHDLDLVRRVCDRIVVLDFGRVIADGDPEVVLKDHAVLEAYLGEVSAQ